MSLARNSEKLTSHINVTRQHYRYSDSAIIVCWPPVPSLLPQSIQSDLSISGADIRSVCTEAGMFAIRARRKVTFHLKLLGVSTL